MSVSPVRAAVLVLPLQQELSQGWRLRSSTQPDPAWRRARVLRKVLSSSCLQVLSSSCLQVLKLLELYVDLQIVSHPSLCVAFLPTLAIPWSWFAEGCDEFLALGWGLLLSCNTANSHGYCVFANLRYLVQQHDFLKKLHFKVRQNPPHLLRSICH